MKCNYPYLLHIEDKTSALYVFLSAVRGNVVMRAAARKNTPQEGDHSVNVDIASGIGVDPVARMPLRTGKSKTKIIIQRLIRTLRMLTVISAVNVPLYMMLLFKDWIDK